MKIVIAEDDPDIREDMVEQLRRNGHCVHAVSSATELLDKLKRERYELIVTDNNMEISDSGLYALEHIRSRSELKTIPVIMYSSDNFAKPQAEKLGAIFIQKHAEGSRILMEAVKHFLH